MSPAAAREVEDIIRSRLLSQYGDFMLLLSAKVTMKEGRLHLRRGCLDFCLRRNDGIEAVRIETTLE